MLWLWPYINYKEPHIKLLFFFTRVLTKNKNLQTSFYGLYNIFCPAISSALSSLFPRFFCFAVSKHKRIWINETVKQIGRYLIRYAHNRIYDLGLSIHEAVYSETLMNWPCPKAETLLRRTYTFDSVCFRYAFLSRISKAKTVKRTLFQTDNFFIPQIKRPPALRRHK